MRVAVIGATGHIGTYLVPQLVTDGHEVIAITRNRRVPYVSHPAYDEVELITADREAEDRAGSFGKRLKGLAAEAIIDLICYELASAAQVVEALRGSETLLIHCGTIWVHGPATTVPMTEDAPRRPMEPYGVAKAEIERLLLEESSRGAVRAVVLHPGHITGPGWRPVNPAGNLSLDVFSKLAKGERLCLPNLGLETVHHVHAEDVALAFVLALARPEVAVGRAFHVVSANALTLRGYAEEVARWFGREAVLSFMPFEDWSKTVSDDEAATTWSHISHSPSASIDRARRLLGYEPRYSSLEAIHQALEWLTVEGEVDVAGAALSPLGGAPAGGIQSTPDGERAAHSERETHFSAGPQAQ